MAHPQKRVNGFTLSFETYINWLVCLFDALPQLIVLLLDESVRDDAVQYNFPKTAEKSKIPTVEGEKLAYQHVSIIHRQSSSVFSNLTR